jgi:UDP-2-acetamido-3-amino-2,3-dideoxy-glucuronate N-acetyltransferase
MKSFIIGTGEVGSALSKVLAKKYEVRTYDIKDGEPFRVPHGTQIVHIAIPFNENFSASVQRYTDSIRHVVIHSSVPVGTSEAIGAMHSPVRGMHPEMSAGLHAYVKYVSYDDAHQSPREVKEYFEDCGIRVKVIKGTKNTELMKLLELSRYGVYLAFAKEQERICSHFGLNYSEVVTEYDETRNEGLEFLGLSKYKNPLLDPFNGYVGGHCTVEDMGILLNQIKTPVLEKSYEIDRNTFIWGNSNIYPTAKIGKGCSIGQFCEIGNKVVIGDNVRIGAFTFIPEGVTIEDDVFIAPKASFSNDKYPPANDKNKWGKILIKKGAVLGMGCVILPNVTIGEGALIGAGAVITKNVPSGEKWYGVPAVSHGKK